MILRRNLRLSHEPDWALAACARQLVDARDVTTDAEATIAAKLPLAIKHRKPRQLDREPLAALVDRPGDGDTAPGFVRRNRPRNLIVRIELKLGRDFAPHAAECSGGARSHEFGEFIGADNKAAVGIHLPDEAQRVAPLGHGLLRHSAAGALHRWRCGGRRCGLG